MTGLVFIVATLLATVTIRNYRRVHSTDYLLFMVIYIMNFVQGRILAIQNVLNETPSVWMTDPILTIIPILNSILLYPLIGLWLVHSIRLKWGWEEKPILILVIGILLLIIEFMFYYIESLIVNVGIIPQYIGPIDILLIRILVYGTTYLYIFGVLVYAYSTVDLAYSTTRTRSVRWIFILWGVSNAI